MRRLCLGLYIPIEPVERVLAVKILLVGALLQAFDASQAPTPEFHVEVDKNQCQYTAYQSRVAAQGIVHHQQCIIGSM